MRRRPPQFGDFGKLLQKPRIDLGQLVNPLDRPAAGDGAEQIPDAAVMRDSQTFAQRDIIHGFVPGRSAVRVRGPE